MSYFKALRDKEAREQAREYKENEKARAAAREHARVSKILQSNPEIGVIIRKGKPMYYTGAGDNMTKDIDSLIK